MSDLEEIQNKLIPLTPAERLKFLRKRIVKKNQDEFCQDGIIRSGTLKSIETKKLKISPRIAQRLIHKFSLEGVVCSDELFLKEQSQCRITYDLSRKNIISSSTSTLEDIRNKLSILTPIDIDKEICPQLFPSGGTALVKELNSDDIQKLDNSLCLVHGEKKFISFLSYEEENIISEFNGKIERFHSNIANFCGLYAIEIVYYNN